MAPTTDTSRYNLLSAAFYQLLSSNVTPDRNLGSSPGFLPAHSHLYGSAAESSPETTQFDFFLKFAPCDDFGTRKAPLGCFWEEKRKVKQILSCMIIFFIPFEGCYRVKTKISEYSNMRFTSHVVSFFSPIQS